MSIENKADKPNQKQKYLFFGVFFIMGSLLVLFKIFSLTLLPAKYYFDSYNILGTMESSKEGFNSFGSFEFTAAFYNSFNFMGTYDWTEWTLIINTCVLPLFIYFLSKRNDYGKVFFIWCIASFVLIEIYILHVSKDLINFLLISIYAVPLMKGKKKTFLIVFGLFSFVMSLYFRQYYILIYLVFILLLILKKANLKMRFSIIFIVLIGLLYIIPDSLFIEIFNKRSEINYYRDLEDTNTMIIDLLPGNNRSTVLTNCFINVIRLIFPIEVLFLQFNPMYFLFFIYLSIMTIVIVINYIRNRREKNEVLDYFIIWGISVVSVHSIFEGDYGSYLRHFISYFSIWYFHVIYFSKYLYKTKRLE